MWYVRTHAAERAEGLAIRKRFTKKGKQKKGDEGTRNQSGIVAKDREREERLTDRIAVSSSSGWLLQTKIHIYCKMKWLCIHFSKKQRKAPWQLSVFFVKDIQSSAVGGLALRAARARCRKTRCALKFLSRAHCTPLAQRYKFSSMRLLKPAALAEAHFCGINVTP